ncbi:alpha/beta hydrolase fold [Raineyella antarctica]|uniref:Alpha/beta hydrolase fold n=1 Tax=Raineyella antarctica TaxID=1577474 RepID=A0A1G6GDD3_9ACTN|nr:alpha/beta fold hydrolase [Raineyella antarctica]SDB80001.1 alpha/beta hydrolase fold [Raineyella antarctica]
MRTTTTHLPGLTLTDLVLEVPLDHLHAEAGSIEVFARVVTGEGGEDRPYLVYLQGGPGFEAPRPTLVPASPPWLPRALEDFRVVLLDQRGTGRSTPLSSAVTAMAPDDQAAYLTHFRADEVVNDCEAVRQALGASTWTVLGQSFGGFTTLRYLSEHPESLAGALLTGGLSAVGHPIDDVYAATWQVMVDKSGQHYRRFPEDRDRVRRLSELCTQGAITLPNGDAVSADRFRTIGHRLGMQGGSEQLHYLLELDHRSPAFAHDLAAALPFTGRNPIYSVLHEACYADGVATRWSADRTMPDRVREDPTLLGGEHLHRSLFAEDSELAPFAGVADRLAGHEWGRLYSPERLARADVPVAAAVYHADAYVPREFSLETAAMLPDCRTWVTSEYEHNGLRMDPGVLDHLIGLLRGRRWL